MALFQPQTIQRQLALTDIGTRIRVSTNQETPMEVTIPSEELIPWPSGAWVEVMNIGVQAPSSLSILAEAGVTLLSSSGTLVIEIGQYARITRVSDVSNTWDVHIYGLPGTHAPLNEVVLGGATSNTSSSDFTIDPITGDLSFLTSAQDGLGGVRIFTSTNSVGQGGARLEMTKPGQDGSSRIELHAGSSNVQGQYGADLNMSAGSGSDSTASDPGGYGGSVRLDAGFGGYRAGAVTISAGGSGLDGVGGAFIMKAGGGGTGGDFTIEAGNSLNADFGGSVYISSGYGVGVGGHIYLKAGGSPAESGNVYITGGSTGSLTSAGQIIFTTNEQVQLSIDKFGGVRLGASNNAGLSGQVLTSNGDGSPVSWSSVQATVVKPSPMVTVIAGTSTMFGSAADHNKHYRTIAGTTVTITVPPDSTWGGTQQYFDNNFNPTAPGPMPTGGSAAFGKHGAGNVVFVPGVGVTINTPDTYTIDKLHGKVTLIKVGPNEWDLEGHLAQV